MEKECRRCFESKPLLEYYQHKQMFDGHLNICKECTRNRVGVHREQHLKRIKEYDRNRPNKKERVQKVKERRDWMKVNDKEKYQQQVIKPKKDWGDRNPEKRRAVTIVNNAVRDKRLEKPERCSQCDALSHNLQGHHPDYSKPLEVIWLCLNCHYEEHMNLRSN